MFQCVCLSSNHCAHIPVSARWRQEKKLTKGTFHESHQILFTSLHDHVVSSEAYFTWFGGSASSQALKDLAEGPGEPWHVPLHSSSWAVVTMAGTQAATLDSEISRFLALELRM